MARAAARPRPATATDGQLSAAGALSRTIMHPDVTGVIDDYKRLTTDEARMAFADHFLARTAGVMDEIWPTFYELLKRVEDSQLYSNPAYIGEGCAFATFKEYFEHRVGRPFETWSQMEVTYHYARDFKPELFGGSYDKARQTQEADRRDQEQQKTHGGDRRSTDFNVDNIHVERPSGTGRATALRRLRKEADSGNAEAAELRVKVLAGEMSPHAAMIEAGFRPKAISVPVGKPERVAAYLRKHMPREALKRLVELLTQEESDTGRPEGRAPEN